jgi:hypothetical protein
MQSAELQVFLRARRGDSNLQPRQYKFHGQCAYYLQAAERIGGNRACLAVARKLLKRCYHRLRELGEEALQPA